MNPLVKKEIRLLLPSWLAVLSLDILLPWFGKDPDATFAWMPAFIFFGMIILAVDSFGREFSLGTFQLLLSQPVERRRIWRVKIMVLLFAAALIFAAFFTGCELRLHLALTDSNSVWHVNPTIIGSDFRNAMFGSVASLLIALTGGLWTALLLRQIAAAFWITFLTPAGLLMLIVFFLPSKLSDHVVIPLLYSMAGIYIVSGFWLAHRLFHRAQDAAWTGGIISFSKWRYYDAGTGSSVSARQWKPLSALLKKEFQLHSISLICVGALFVLHLAVFFLRSFYSNFHRNSLADVVSDMFWVLWLVMPLMIGCMAVAEERKLGVTETQFCLPVSRRFQFATKFIPAMIFGTLLGGIMPLILEMLAGHFGAPNEYFKPESHSGYMFGIVTGMDWFEISIVALAAGFALVGFYASTLARNFLQALSIAIVAIVGCCLFTMFLFAGWSSENGQFALWGMKLWGVILPRAIGISVAILVFPCLAYRNFSHFVESGRLWRRNIVGVIGALLFVFASSAAIYNRFWEIFEPAEPTHSPAIFSSANMPTLRGDGLSGLQVRFPNGRIWFDSLGYPFFKYQSSRWQLLWWSLVRPLPVGAGPQQFMAGSNWISATTYHIEFMNPVGGNPRQVIGYLDTVGVQADGTLWISSDAKPVAWTGAKMIRFGDETNWQQVVRKDVGLLLLKRNGTLWQWGTNRLDWSQWQTNWPTVRASKPQQIGTDSDWQEVFKLWNIALARKNDGRVWLVNWDWKVERETNLDQIFLETFSDSGNNSLSYIGKDGTLWTSYRYFDKNDREGTRRFLQVGKETNWVATVMTSRTTTWNWMVSLKSDGSLWQWHFSGDSQAEVAKIPPTRLGIHQDWIGLTGAWDGAVALAADGSLWFWPNPEYFDGALMKAPKQPQFLGNVFGKRIEKLQAPTSKLQRNFKYQPPTDFGDARLMFGACHYSGAWRLGFGALRCLLWRVRCVIIGFVDTVTKLTNELVASYARLGGINHLDGKNLPSNHAITAITQNLLRLLFPGFFDEKPIHSSEIKVVTAELLDSVLGALEDEIYKSLEYNPPPELPRKSLRSAAHSLTLEFLESLPRLREVLQTDVEAAYNGDPAALSREEVIVSYPFVEAIAVQRLAHELYLKNIALIPRIMTEWAHSRTGMDLHPGAQIGSHFFVDHCTGTVVGETTVIGDRVKMYQGVGLVAKSLAAGQALRGQKRHPTLEDRVTIYAGATIMGGDTVVGEGSTIGANVFLTNSVPPYSLVTQENANVKVMKKERAKKSSDFQI